MLLSVALAGVLVWLFPALLSGPYADAGPLARTHVLPVDYAYSLATSYDRVQFAAGPSAALLVLAYLVVVFREQGRRPVWVAALIVLLGGFLLGCFTSDRFSPYLMLAAVPSWAALLHHAVRRLWSLKPSAARALAPVAVLVLAFWPYGLAVMLHGPEKITWRLPGESPSCRYNDLAFGLDQLRPDHNKLIATNLFEGPQMAFETGRPVVTGPYMAEASLRDYIDFFYGPPETVHRVVRELGVNLVVLCRSKIRLMEQKQGAPGSIMRGLVNRKVPPYLYPIRMPPNLAIRYRVFVINFEPQ